MRRRLVLIAALAVVAALAFPHGALADNGDDGAGEAEFHGVIESLPDPGPVGDWTVSGVTVHVTDATELEGNNTGDCNDDDGDNDNEGDDEGDGDNGDGDDGDLRSTSADDPGDDGDDETCDETVTFAVGDDVKVEGVLEADGSITASQIEADDEGDDENGDGDDSDDGTLVMK